MRIPFIRVSCSLPLYYEPDIPPMWSDALPGQLSRRELEVEWMCHEAMLWRQPWIHRDNPIGRGEFYKFVESCGLHVAQINYRSTFNWHVESDPEIVTCSKAFDFPRPDVPDRAYIGPCLAEVLAERWSHASRRPDAPLIYCAFGSKGSSYPVARRLIGRLLDAARQRPDLDIVIASMPDDAYRDHEIPPTVHTVRWAPQREVLREADLFITHAGLSSCREAIWEGVPMLAVPQAHDQHGVAARIAYHGLGERVLGDVPSTAALIDAIDRLLGEPHYQQAAARMCAQFRSDASDGIGPRFVVDVMEGKIQPPTAAYYEDVTRRLFRAIMGEG
jgi:MGT family glycosyltransferase